MAPGRVGDRPGRRSGAMGVAEVDGPPRNCANALVRELAERRNGRLRQSLRHTPIFTSAVFTAVRVRSSGRARVVVQPESVPDRGPLDLRLQILAFSGWESSDLEAAHSVSSMTSERINRRVIEVVTARMREVPVLVLQGPRSVGKSTVLHQIAQASGAQVLNLDVPAVRRSVLADPSQFVEGPDTAFIDEYQRVPDILDAIKVEVDADFRPGRFLLAGSTRFDALPRSTQALTGRVHFVSILPFSQGELAGVREDFLDIAVTDPQRLATGLGDRLTREEYAELICRGGMPIAVRSPQGRNRWFDDYATSSLERDIAAITSLRRGAELPALFTRLASQTGQVLNVSAAARAVGLDVTTAASYVTLLEHLFLLHRLPAWGRTLRARATASPKLHLTDSGLAARLLRITPARLARLDPASLTEFGHLLESFVVGELLKQASWSEHATTLGHWRTHDGQEVDLILERGDGAVTGFEVKAGRDVQRNDARGLVALRDTLGQQFTAGIVLTTGDTAYRLDDRIYVVPIHHLWAPTPPSRKRRG